MVGAEWTSELPYDTTPVTKIGQHRYVIRPDYKYQRPRITIIRTLEEYCAKLPQYEQTILKNVNIMNSSGLIEAIVNNK